MVGSAHASFPKMENINVQNLAGSLHQIQTTRPTEDGLRRVWFQGGEPYFDVFVDFDRNMRVCWFQLTLRGRAVTWSGGRLTTGITNELSIGEGKHPQTKLLQDHNERDEELIKLAMYLLLERLDDKPLRAAAETLFEAMLPQLE
jgi:hypothetical protein